MIFVECFLPADSLYSWCKTTPRVQMTEIVEHIHVDACFSKNDSCVKFIHTWHGRNTFNIPVVGFDSNIEFCFGLKNHIFEIIHMVTSKRKFGRLISFNFVTFDSGNDLIGFRFCLLLDQLAHGFFIHRFGGVLKKIIDDFCSRFAKRINLIRTEKIIKLGEEVILMSNTKRTGQTALYERLSRDDEMQGESNSITNQK